MPTDLMLARAVKRLAGCFAGGRILAGNGAVRQRTGDWSNTGIAANLCTCEQQESLTGW